MVFIVVSLEDESGDAQPKTWCYTRDSRKADQYYAKAMNSLDKFLKDNHEENCSGGCEDDPREYCECSFRYCTELHKDDDDEADCNGVDEVEEMEDWVKERLLKNQPKDSSIVKGINGSCGGEWLVYVVMLKVPVWSTAKKAGTKRKREEA